MYIFTCLRVSTHIYILSVQIFIHISYMCILTCVSFGKVNR